MDERIRRRDAVSVASSDGGQAPHVSASTHFWAIPWVLIGIIVAIILIVLADRWRRRRKRASRVAQRIHQLTSQLPLAPCFAPLSKEPDLDSPDPSCAAHRIVGLITVGLAVLGIRRRRSVASDQVPYTDSGASGDITLCDRDLNPVTEGSINDIPFAWRAVGSQAAPAPYNGDTRAATLYYFQPRRGRSRRGVDVAPG